MTETRHPTLDPAAFEVLREVANQEHSVLLRVPTARAGPRSIDIWLAREPISHGAAFLSSAERHLLEVHRDEVASWMRLAAFQGLFEDPEKSGLMARELDAKSLIELPGRPALRDQAYDLLRAADPRHLPPEAAPLLRRATARRAPRPQNPWTLAALSLRLVPHPVPQQWFAVRSLGVGELQSVRRFLTEQESSAPTGAIRNHYDRTTAELRGSIAFATADWTAACEAYRSAATSAVGVRLNALWWALNAAQSGKTAMLREAAKLFDSHGPLSSELRASATTVFALATSNRAWRPRAECRRLVSKLDGQCGGLLQTWCA